MLHILFMDECTTYRYTGNLHPEQRIVIHTEIEITTTTYNKNLHEVFFSMIDDVDTGPCSTSCGLVVEFSH